MRKDHAPLIVAALSLVRCRSCSMWSALPLRSAIDVVVFAIACMGLNILVGYTGLVSFGHGAWFGLGAYAAALSQRYWFPGDIILPALFAPLFVAASALLSGALILRRRGVYFSLLTLALTALLFAIGYRWTELTGGESGLGGVTRSTVLGIDLERDRTYYGLVAVLGMAVCYLLWRFHRSPVGSVLVAIRENEQRARFVGYPTNRYKLIGFVLSAAVVALAGTLSVFNHRFASAEPLSVAFSGELIAMVVIGGMRSFLGPGARRPVLHPVPRISVDLDAALAVLVRPAVRRLHRVLADRPGRRRRAVDRAVSPARRSRRRQWRAARYREVRRCRRSFAARRRTRSAGAGRRGPGQAFRRHPCGRWRCRSPVRTARLHALIGPNGAGKTTAFNLVCGLYPPDRGTIELDGRSIAGLKPGDITAAGVGRSFQITNLFGGAFGAGEPAARRAGAPSPSLRGVALDPIARRRHGRNRRTHRLPRACRHRARRGGLAVLWRPAPARHGPRARDAPAHPAAR